jgi:superfamily I DNA/RNA helicase
MAWFIPATRLDPTEQLPFLQQIENNPGRNYWLKGFAGSGKSVLLLHCLLIDKRKNPNTKAIIVLYTYSLIDMIKEGLPNEYANTEVVTFYQFRNRHENYDLILVDEIQDLPEHDIREICSKTTTNGRVIFAGDINQSIYDHSSSSGTISEILQIPQKATVTSLNKIWRLSRRIRKISAEYCNDKQNYEAAQVMDFNANVPVSLIKSDSFEQECKWLWYSSKEYGNAGYVPAILISNKDKIIQFISSVLRIENKPPLNNEWINNGEIQFNSINNHLRNNGIKLQYLGNKFGSFEKAYSDNLVTIITYHSSKGLDFKTVFIPFLNINYQIFGDYTIARALFFVALTRSREQLILSYSGNQTHPFLTQTIISECTPKNAVDELRRIQNPLGGINNGEDVVVI